MRRLCSKYGVRSDKKKANDKWRPKNKAELVADFEAWERRTASQPQSAPDEKDPADRERKREQAKARGKAFGQALPADEVSRPSDEERKDYDAMNLKEKNAFGSAWFA